MTSIVICKLNVKIWCLKKRKNWKKFGKAEKIENLEKHWKNIWNLRQFDNLKKIGNFEKVENLERNGNLENIGRFRNNIEISKILEI